MIAQNSSWTSTIPKTVPSGNYLIRFETIALHSLPAVSTLLTGRIIVTNISSLVFISNSTLSMLHTSHPRGRLSEGSLDALKLPSLEVEAFRRQPASLYVSCASKVICSYSFLSDASFQVKFPGAYSNSDPGRKLAVITYRHIMILISVSSQR